MRSSLQEEKREETGRDSERGGERGRGARGTDVGAGKKYGKLRNEQESSQMLTWSGVPYGRVASGGNEEDREVLEAASWLSPICEVRWGTPSKQHPQMSCLESHLGYHLLADRGTPKVWVLANGCERIHTANAERQSEQPLCYSEGEMEGKSTSREKKRRENRAGKGSAGAGSHQPRWPVETAPALDGLRGLLLEGSAIIVFIQVLVLIIFCYKPLPPSDLSPETKSN